MSVPFSMLPGGRGSLQHLPVLWIRQGRRWVGDPHEKADWICSHQTEAMMQYFSSGLGRSLGWFVQNEIYLPSSSHPIQPWKTSTTWWLIGAETLPGQGQKECDPPTFCRSLTDGLNGPHTLYSFGCFPSLSSSDSWKVWYSFAGFDMLLPEAGKAPLLLIWPSKLALRKSSM